MIVIDSAKSQKGQEFSQMDSERGKIQKYLGAR